MLTEVGFFRKPTLGRDLHAGGLAQNTLRGSICRGGRTGQRERVNHRADGTEALCTR